MDGLSLIVHILNFLAPAMAVGAWITLVYTLLWRKGSTWQRWKTSFVLNSLAGALILLIGLLWFGQDGKMVTYLAMVLACASSQWLLSRKPHA
ncbi:MAG: hypothetical protein EBZ60_04775 [Betaproteobacteria bacterium]|nr:hypothetical protein [Betaproteobacteria bacterium]